MRRQLVLVVLIGIAPVLASYAFYYLRPRQALVNYGVLHAVPSPPISGRLADGRPFALADLRGKWLVIVASGGACDTRCSSALYAGRQARTIQNAEMDRVVRLWLVTDDTRPSTTLLSEHPDLTVVRVAPETAAALPEQGRGLALIDPLGNLVLSWPSDPDIKAVARDLGRVLRASSIG